MLSATVWIALLLIWLESRHMSVGRLPERFAVYSGNDDSALALMAMGADGVISVTANVAPKPMAEMCAAALAGDFAKARTINRKLITLHERLFSEPNPVPVKWAYSEEIFFFFF